MFEYDLHIIPFMYIVVIEERRRGKWGEKEKLFELLMLLLLLLLFHIHRIYRYYYYYYRYYLTDVGVG